ncbi:MAG: hypothetical protein ACKVS7_13355 [Gemmatimonadaceae bacterium]
MISAAYFRAAFASPAGSKSMKERADVHLVSGTVFEIERVESVEEGYVVLRVVPSESGSTGADRSRAKRAPDAGAAVDETDRLVLAYESISGVHFSPLERRPEHAVGF